MSNYYEFIQSNPHVLDQFIAKTKAILARGHKRVSQRMVWEVLRFENLVASDPSSPFRLNDHYLAPLTRDAIKACPELGGCFELRSARVDEEETANRFADDPLQAIWDAEAI